MPRTGDWEVTQSAHPVIVAAFDDLLPQFVIIGREGAVGEPEALAQYRYRAVCEVLGGSPVGEVAQRYGTSRQSLHTWRRRFEQEGVPGMADRTRRPQTSPT